MGGRRTSKEELMQLYVELAGADENLKTAQRGQDFSEADCVVLLVLHSNHKSEIEEVLRPIYKTVVDATSGVFLKAPPLWKIGTPNPQGEK